jgi:hypothetical protein
MAKRGSAVHAPRTLSPEFFLRKMFVKLPPVFDPFLWRPGRRQFTPVFHKTGWLAHIVSPQYCYTVSRILSEAFEKYSFLFKFKESENFNHRNTLSISRINPPKFDGGLKFELDPREIGFAFHRAGAETCPPPADWAKWEVFQRSLSSNAAITACSPVRPDASTRFMA